MAAGFNLTAQLNLKGPSNVSVIVADIKKQLGTINASVNLTIAPAATTNLNRINAALLTFNRTLSTTTGNANAAATAIRNLSTSIGSINASNLPQVLNSSATALNRVAQASTNNAKQLRSASSEMTEFGRQAGLAFRRFSAITSVTSVIYGLTNAINNGVRAYIDYDRELVKLQQVTGQSAAGLKGLETTITSLATGLGVGSAELTQISSTLAQAGLSARDTERALKALALSSLAPSFDSMNETVEGSIALMRQFGINAGDLEKALGSVNSVAAKFAVEAADLITAIQRTGGVFATASKGVSEGTDALNEFLAVFTSIRATTRESAETIATGLRTIFTRIQRGDTIEALKEYGVNLQDLDGKFVGAYKAVELLSKGLGNLDPRDLKFSKIVEELGGFRQIGKVIPLIQQFATAQDALKVAQTGQGSLAADAAKAQESLAVQISKVREQFLALFRDIGKSDSFQAIAQGALSVTSALIKAADSIKGILPVLGVMLAFKGASAAVQFGSGFLSGIRGSGGAKGLGNRLGGGPGMSSGGPVRRFASGGLVPGSGDTDSIDAKLMPGEFVMSKPAVKAIGSHNLHRMNKYTEGGKVGPIEIKTLPQAVSLISQNPRVAQYINPKQDSASASIQQITPNMLSLDVKTISREIYNDMRKGLPISQANQKFLLGKNKPTPVQSKSYAGLLSRRGQDFLAGKEGQRRVDELGTQRESPKWSEAYERLLSNHMRDELRIRNYIPTGEIENVPYRNSYPIDLISKNGRSIGEVKFRPSGVVSKTDYLDKLLRARVTRNITQPFTKFSPETKDIGNIEVFEMPNKSSVIEEIRRLYKKDQTNKASGGFIRKFANAGLVTPTSGTAATSTEIFRVLTLDEVIKDTGSNAGDIQKILKKRKSLSPTEQAIKDKILAKYTEKTSGIKAANALDIEKATTEGLLFGAAGFKGKAFATTPRMDIPGLKNPVKVRITSGVLDSEMSKKLLGKMTVGLNDIANKTSRNIMIKDILKQTGPLYADFDRTLAFGADKILADPRKPKYSEFSNREKVSGALKTAKLSALGKAIANTVKQTPSFADNLHIISARPQSTMDLIAGWLAQQGIPIPLGRIKGVGGENITAEQVAILKADLMNPEGAFIDDDDRNIAEAEKRGIRSYLYKKKRVGPTSRKKLGEANAKGYLAERVINELGGPIANKAATNYGIDFPDGLQSAAKYFNLPQNIPTDAKLTLNGPAELKSQIGNYLKARGYASGGHVQAMVSNGEAYIPPEAAKEIGYSRLNEMNQADRNGMSKFAKGGIGVFKGPGNGTSDSIGPIDLPVGSFILRERATKALGLYASGGSVGLQTFASGGPGLPIRPETIQSSTIRINQESITSLKQLEQIIQELGLSSKKVSSLLLNEGRVSYASAEKAAKSEVDRVKAAGGSISQIIAAENALATIRKSKNKEVGKNNALESAFSAVRDRSSGEVQQQILLESNKHAQDVISRAEEARAKQNKSPLTEEQKNKIYESSTLRATSSITGVSRSDLKSQGIVGEDVRKYAQQSMMDRKFLAQMDKEYRVLRTQELISLGKGAAEARALTEKELADRRIAARNMATAAGLAGPGRDLIPRYTGTGLENFGSNFAGLRKSLSPKNLLGTGNRMIQSLGGLGTGNAGYFASLGLGIIAGQGNNIAGMLPGGGDKKTRSKVGAGIEAGVSTFASGLSIASSAALIPVVGPYIAAFTLAGTALLSLKEGFNGATKAVKEFEQAERTKKIEDIDEKIAKGVEAAQKTGNNDNLIRPLTDRLKLNDDDFAIKIKNAAENKANSRGILGSFMGGPVPKLDKKDIDQLVSEQSKQNSGAAKVARDIIESKISRGSTLSDISQDPGFAALADSISSADNEFLAFVAKINDMEDAAFAATGTTKQKRIQEELASRRIALLKDEVFLAAQRTAVTAKAMEELERSTRKATQGFDSLGRSILSAVSKVEFNTNNAAKIRRSNSEALTGKPRVANADSEELDMLKNPEAYAMERDRVKSNYRKIAFEITNPNAQGIPVEEKKSRINQANLISDALGFDQTKIDEIQGNLNKRIADAINSDKGNEDLTKLGPKLETALDESTKGLPDVIRNNLKLALKNTIDEVDKLKFDKPGEKVDKLSDEIDKKFGNSIGNMTDTLRKGTIAFLEFKNKGADRFVESLNRIVDSVLAANESLDKARNIATETDLTLKEALTGAPTSIRQRIGIRDNEIKNQTAGTKEANQIVAREVGFNLNNSTADPKLIRQNIENLAEARKKLSERELKTPVTDRGPIQSDMANLDLQIIKNKNALEKLANSSDIVTAAFGQLRDAQKMQADRLQNLDQILSSTPQELQKLNESLIRVQQRMMGINPGPSRAAKQAYDMTFRQTGGNRFLAMQAGQAQMAQDRGIDLRTMEQYKSNFILDIKNRAAAQGKELSDQDAEMEFRKRSGNLRGQMANELGFMNPGVAQTIMASVDPTRDPVIAQLADTIKVNSAIQVSANEQIAALFNKDAISENTSAILLLKEQIENFSGVLAGLQNIKLADLGINNPLRKADGGVIYASVGGSLVNFSPKGTDTVPAMLTPGEFVVNARATAQNLSLLESINSGNSLVGNTAMMSSGGVVYLSTGGRTRKDIEDKLKQERIESDNINQTIRSRTEAYKAPDSKERMEDEKKQKELLDEEARLMGGDFDKFREVSDRRIAHETEMRRKSSSYKTEEERSRLGRIEVNGSQRYAAQANMGDESATTDRSLLNDLDLVENRPNDSNMGRIGVNSVNNALRDAGIPERALAFGPGTGLEFHSDGINWTQRIADEQAKPDFGARVSQYYIKEKEKERKLAEERLKKENVQYNTNPVKPPVPAGAPVPAVPPAAPPAKAPAAPAPVPAVPPAAPPAKAPAAPAPVPAAPPAAPAPPAGAPAPPARPKVFRKPNNMGEIGLFREGLARGMTIDEIKAERQRNFLKKKGKRPIGEKDASKQELEDFRKTRAKRFRDQYSDTSAAAGDYRPSLVPGDPRAQIPGKQNLDDFYRLDVNEDGVLSGKERTAYSELDTDKNKEISTDEWLGRGFDPGDVLQRHKYGIDIYDEKKTAARARELSEAMPSYEEKAANNEPIFDIEGNPTTLEEKRKELATLQETLGYYKTPKSLIASQRNRDDAVASRLNGRSWVVDRALQRIYSDRRYFEENRQKIQSQNPDADPDKIFNMTVDSIRDQQYGIGRDENFWRSIGVTSTPNSYNESSALSHIRDKEDLSTRDDPTGQKTRDYIDEYKSSQSAREQSNRVDRGNGRDIAGPDRAIVGTQGPVGKMNNLIDEQEKGNPAINDARQKAYEKQQERRRVEGERQMALDARDKELGMITSDRGGNPPGYDPGSAASAGFEQQKQRRREQIIESQYKFTNKDGTASTTGTIDNVDFKAGTVRIAKIDPKTGMPITRKIPIYGNGEVTKKQLEAQGRDPEKFVTGYKEEQIYTTVPLDQLSDQSRTKVRAHALEKEVDKAKTGENFLIGNDSGKQISGRIYSVNEKSGSAVIQRANGTRFTVPLDKLAPQSRNIALEQSRNDSTISQLEHNETLKGISEQVSADINASLPSPPIPLPEVIPTIEDPMKQLAMEQDKLDALPVMPPEPKKSGARVDPITGRVLDAQKATTAGGPSRAQFFNGNADNAKQEAIDIKEQQATIAIEREKSEKRFQELRSRAIGQSKYDRSWLGEYWPKEWGGAEKPKKRLTAKEYEELGTYEAERGIPFGDRRGSTVSANTIRRETLTINQMSQLDKQSLQDTKKKLEIARDSEGGEAVGLAAQRAIVPLLAGTAAIAGAPIILPALGVTGLAAAGLTILGGVTASLTANALQDVALEGTDFDKRQKELAQKRPRETAVGSLLTGLLTGNPFTGSSTIVRSLLTRTVSGSTEAAIGAGVRGATNRGDFGTGQDALMDFISGFILPSSNFGGKGTKNYARPEGPAKPTSFNDIAQELRFEDFNRIMDRNDRLAAIEKKNQIKDNKTQIRDAQERVAEAREAQRDQSIFEFMSPILHLVPNNGFGIPGMKGARIPMSESSSPIMRGISSLLSGIDSEFKSAGAASQTKAQIDKVIAENPYLNKTQLAEKLVKDGIDPAIAEKTATARNNKFLSDLAIEKEARKAEAKARFSAEYKEKTKDIKDPKERAKIRAEINEKLNKEASSIRSDIFDRTKANEAGISVTEYRQQKIDAANAKEQAEVDKLMGGMFEGSSSSKPISTTGKPDDYTTEAWANLTPQQQQTVINTRSNTNNVETANPAVSAAEEAAGSIKPVEVEARSPKDLLERAKDDPTGMKQGLYNTEVRAGSYEDTGTMLRWFKPKEVSSDYREPINTGYKPRFAVQAGQMDEMISRMAADPELAQMLGPFGFKQHSFEDSVSGRDKRFLVAYGKKGTAEEAIAITKRMEALGDDILFAGGAKDYGDTVSLGKFGTTRYDPNIDGGLDTIDTQKLTSALKDLRKRWLAKRKQEGTDKTYDPRFDNFEVPLMSSLRTKGGIVSEIHTALYKAGKLGPSKMMDEFYRDYPDLFPTYKGDISYTDKGGPEAGAIPQQKASVDQATKKATETPVNPSSISRVDQLASAGFGVISGDQEVESVIRSARRGFSSDQPGKPAALLTSAETYDKYKDQLLELEQSGKLKIGRSAGFVKGQPNMFVGKPENVDILTKTFDAEVERRRTNGTAASEEFHDTVGKALGYSKDSRELYRLRKDWDKAGLDINIIQDRLRKGDKASDMISEINGLSRATKSSEEMSSFSTRISDFEKSLDDLINPPIKPASSPEVVAAGRVSSEKLEQKRRASNPELAAVKDRFNKSWKKAKAAGDTEEMARIKNAADAEYRTLLEKKQQSKSTRMLLTGLGMAAPIGGTIGYGLYNLLSGSVTPKDVVGEENTEGTAKMPMFDATNNNAAPMPNIDATNNNAAKMPVIDPDKKKRKNWKTPSGGTGYATGGLVYASNGAFINAQPMGTDTVPAMLTPGEFVINRQAAQQHMPMLQAINSGAYSQGGVVKYLAEGGMVAPMVAPPMVMPIHLSDGGSVSPQYFAKGGNVNSGNMTLDAKEFKAAMQEFRSITNQFGEHASNFPGQLAVSQSVTQTHHHTGLGEMGQQLLAQAAANSQVISNNTSSTLVYGLHKNSEAQITAGNPDAIMGRVGHTA